MDANFIKELRKSLKITQSVLAKELGVDIRTIRNWENGGTIPKTKEEILLKLQNETTPITIDASKVTGGSTRVDIRGNGNSIPSLVDLKNYKEKIRMLEQIIQEKDKLLEEKERTISLLNKLLEK